MPIEVSAYASISHNRNVDLGSSFARTRLSPLNGSLPPEARIPAIAHSYIDATVTRQAKSRDCTWTVTEVHVRVMMDIDFNTAKIARGYFDPDEAHPHGYEADAPREPDHWKLDEQNVQTHEESHAQDIVKAVEDRIKDLLNRPGVEEQLTISWPCEDEQGAYQRLHALVNQRVQAMGTQAFEELLADFERHQTNSSTEKKARQAQIAEHSNRE